MRVKDISINKSPVMLGSWCMEITCATMFGDCKSTTYFDDLGGFLTAVKETVVFFAVRMGKLTSKESKRLVSRDIAPNPEGAIK